MATKPTKTEIQTTQPNEMMFAAERPDWLDPSSNRGSENVGTKDLLLPRLEIVQAQSPIKDINEDAREGLLFNTVTQAVYGDSSFIVPIYYRMEYLVWKDQDEGGGFFGAYDTEALARSRLEEKIDEGERREHLEVIDTPVHYCLRVNADMSFEQVVISMPKSKAKVSRKWNSLIQIAGGDRFSRVYKLGTFKDKNAKNQTFYNFTVMPAGFAPKTIYDEAAKLYDMFIKEGVKADHASATSGGDGAAPEGDSELH